MQEEALLSQELEGTSLEDGCRDDAHQSDIKVRWAAATSLYLLYFVCIPPTPQVHHTFTNIYIWECSTYGLL
jgi:hypothetical protein